MRANPARIAEVSLRNEALISGLAQLAPRKGQPLQRGQDLRRRIGVAKIDAGRPEEDQQSKQHESLGALDESGRVTDQFRAGSKGRAHGKKDRDVDVPARQYGRSGKIEEWTMPDDAQQDGSFHHAVQTQIQHSSERSGALEIPGNSAVDRIEQSAEP